jgi:hypothetical protein
VWRSAAAAQHAPGASSSSQLLIKLNLHLPMITRTTCTAVSVGSQIATMNCDVAPSARRRRRNFTESPTKPESFEFLCTRPDLAACK